MNRTSSEESFAFGCAIVSMFGFAITMGTFFVLITMLALWVKVQPQRSTFITIVATNTAQAPLVNAALQVVAVAPTNTSVPSSTPAPLATFTNKPIPTDISTAIATASLAAASATENAQEPSQEFASSGLGLLRTKWEENHTETGKGSLGYEASGVAYSNKYDVIFMEENVWQIYQGWSANNFVSLQDAETEGKALIPLDSQFIQRYSPQGRSETIVDVYMSDSLKKRFSSKHWVYAEPGIFIILYNVYDTGVGSMIIGIDNNP